LLLDCKSKLGIKGLKGISAKNVLSYLFI